MNRKELIDVVQSKMTEGVTKVLVDEFITAFTESVSETLANNEEVRLVGFGTFSAKDRAEKKGRNPATGEEILISARKAPVFKAGSELKARVN